MNTRAIAVSAIALAALLLLCVLVWPEVRVRSRSLPASEAGDATSKSSENENTGVQPLGAPTEDVHLEQKNLLVTLAEAVSKPMRLHGVVVDQAGTPISGATVNYSVSNRLTGMGIENSRGATVSDSEGRFVINERGMGINVRVSKEGYYQILGDDPRASVRGFYNGDRPGKSDELIPPPSTPAVFVLRKMGDPVPLVQLTRRSVMVAKDGTPTEISLVTGERTPAGTGDLRVEAWTNDQDRTAKGRYDWRCRVSVPGGGLIEATGDFAFEAPEDGYVESVELGEKAEQSRWLGDAERQFFLRLADGRHARIKFRMIAAGEHFFLIESALNPEPGSRNLEALPMANPVLRTPSP